MSKSVFDQFADNYDDGLAKAVQASGFKPSYFHEYKIKAVAEQLQKRGLLGKPLSVLSFGCGTGNSEPYMLKHLPNVKIWGTDISAESIRVARETLKDFPQVTYEPFDGAKIPFNQKFEVIFIANVFHHIPRNLHSQVMKEIHEHLKPGGLLFMFELNPINPATLWVAYQNDYKFDPNANLLMPTYTRRLLKTSGFDKTKVNFTIFFPNFVSFMIPYERFLSKMPLGAHYYYVGEKTAALQS